MRLVKLEYGRVDEMSYLVDLAPGQGEFSRDPSLSHVKWVKQFKGQDSMGMEFMTYKGL
jgi:hypothetical protein